ncbi:potassium voltage-gated channel subfamily F member 1 [Eurytemora carolleeae]|uniref:potassium voltage-gated channel subfamily F member 1 n=1 Tax=Eurytemora carolleeae TaxID=1294199 RepID=UPI000C7825DF|nr:potassium voltage-gated channel subfamily F member 1 [Eurytemora carolleeae]|eukprot:XP_023335013.1 potassium voltage-gated channel subfamily F member 1-like [Eurytemora affinis]
MNFIDLLAIIPFYLSLVLEGLEDVDMIGKAGKIVRLVRVMRILRVYKLVRHFAGLQSLIYTLQQAYRELGLLLHLGKHG